MHHCAVIGDKEVEKGIKEIKGFKVHYFDNKEEALKFQKKKFDFVWVSTDNNKEFDDLREKFGDIETFVFEGNRGSDIRRDFKRRKPNLRYYELGNFFTLQPDHREEDQFAKYVTEYAARTIVSRYTYEDYKDMIHRKAIKFSRKYGLEVEEFESIGWMAFEKAKSEYDPREGAFSGHINTCTNNRMHDKVRKLKLPGSRKYANATRCENCLNYWKEGRLCKVGEDLNPHKCNQINHIKKAYHEKPIYLENESEMGDGEMHISILDRVELEKYKHRELDLEETKKLMNECLEGFDKKVFNKLISGSKKMKIVKEMKCELEKIEESIENIKSVFHDIKSG